MKIILKNILIILKGIAMGAADVVPGVSGGTIAFITGIYAELIDSIKSINIQNVRLLFNEGIPAFWKAINGSFLLALASGIAFSIITLARLLKYILETHPILIWSFFFGLIVASAIYVARQINKWNFLTIILLIAGLILAYFITESTPAETPNSYWFIFLTGAIAICAMILPGISGSFIMLLMGKYEFILSVVNELKIVYLLVFASGAVVGLLSFSNLLSWLLKKYHDFTVAVLAGFMIGALNKVWPWKQTLETYTNSHGELKPLIESNIMPSTYESLTGNSSELLFAILFVIIGFALIFVIEKIADYFKVKSEKISS